MPQYIELADRLRLATVVETFIGPDGQSDHTTELGMDAADALEAMAGDLSVMRLKLKAKLSTEQSEEIDRLKAALEFIARGTTGSPDAIIARKALGGDA